MECNGGQADITITLQQWGLLVVQLNSRLKNADHRFYLQVYTTKVNDSLFQSKWIVGSEYDFRPFAKNYITHIPLYSNFILKLPDGLSHYITKIGVVTDFDYNAEWHETWS